MFNLNDTEAVSDGRKEENKKKNSKVYITGWSRSKNQKYFNPEVSLSTYKKQ